MSLARYLFHDFWTAAELNRVDGRMERMRKSAKSASRSRAAIYDRVTELEDDLGRVLLFSRALAEICVRKGLLTREELGAMASEIDLSDGVADGKLDPATLGGRRPDDSPVSPDEHLHRLERSEQETTGEFLRDLERRDPS